MPVSRGLPLIVVYALYYAILLYGRWVFDVLTEICACVHSHIESLSIYHVRGDMYRSYMYDRILVNMYPYDRGSQIFVIINSKLGNLGKELHCYFSLYSL